jgi:hypothetical protein
MNLKATGHYINLIDFNEYDPGELTVGEDFLTPYVLPRSRAS